MKAIDFSDINIQGDLAVRSGLNFTRLEGQWYRPDEVFKADSHGWPADWEGRVILGLTLLAQSTHRTPAYLDEIVSLIPDHLNEKGYFGPILAEGKFDEQHVSGHNWILRGLIEYYNFKKDASVKAILERLVQNFVLPLRGNFAKYPIDPQNRFQDQETWILSKLQTKTKHHAETSDAGCAFIMLDGVTQSYELLGWPALKELAAEIISRYQQMDFLALHIQTHATLSAVRGILRFYELTGERRYLDLAIKMFDLYKTEAWSEAYGNYNWFGAPRWTEPCAIIDSYIVATMLWKHTFNPNYLEDAHLIYFNALCHGQRFNGSFGTDRCVGARETEDNLSLTPINFETYWCCTMRGGEGFSRAIEYQFFLDDQAVYIPFYNNSTATWRFPDGSVKVETRTDFPYYGDVRLTVLESNVVSPRKLCFFAPIWSGQTKIAVYRNDIPQKIEFTNGFLMIETPLNMGDVIWFDLGLTLRVSDAAFKNSIVGYHKFSYGPMLLGYKVKSEINSLDGNRFENYAESKYKAAEAVNIPRDASLERIGRGQFRVKDSDLVLSCLCDVRDLTQEDSVRQVLFKD